jgi:hypothetical protein
MGLLETSVSSLLLFPVFSSALNESYMGLHSTCEEENSEKRQPELLFPESGLFVSCVALLNL